MSMRGSPLAEKPRLSLAQVLRGIGFYHTVEFYFPAIPWPVY